MKKCPNCGGTNLTEIAPINNHRQWLCSDCGKVARSEKSDTTNWSEKEKGKWDNKLTDEPKRTKAKPAVSPEEKAARNTCELLSKIWILVGIVLCSALVITGLVSMTEPDGFLTFVIFVSSGCLSLLSCMTVASVLHYLAARK